MEDISELEAFIVKISAVAAISLYGSPSTIMPIESAIRSAHDRLAPCIRKPIEIIVSDVIMRGYNNLKTAHESILALAYPKCSLYYEG